MLLHRRNLLSVVFAGAAVPAFGLPRAAHAADPHEAERTIGKPDAKVVAQEFFSLTCTHCAAFARETFPQIKSELIDTGKLRWVFRDFPLDQVALTAAMVARYLPPDRYEPFVMALFANQDRWAFARGVDTTDELWKTAALAGMSRATFDQAIGDAGLKNWIMQQREDDAKQWSIDATPSFVVNGKMFSGEMSFDAFRKLVPDA